MDAPEIEKLKALALAAKQHGYKQWINPTAVLTLIAEAESLRADAERYRWLRNEAEGMAGKAAPMVCRLDERGRFVDYLDGEELDDHIDRAAITASKEKA